MRTLRIARPATSVKTTTGSTVQTGAPALSITTASSNPNAPTANCASVNCHGSVNPGMRPISVGRRRGAVNDLMVC